MSRRIAYEGQATNDGRYIKVGALQWAKEIPLLLPLVGYQTHVLGTVTEIERGDAGELIGELSHPVRGLAPEIDLSDVEYEDNDYGLMVVRSGRLRAVTLGTHPCWAGLVIE